MQPAREDIILQIGFIPCQPGDFVLNHIIIEDQPGLGIQVIGISDTQGGKFYIGDGKIGSGFSNPPR